MSAGLILKFCSIVYFVKGSEEKFDFVTHFSHGFAGFVLDFGFLDFELLDSV